MSAPVSCEVPSHSLRGLSRPQRIKNVGYEKGENGRMPEWYLANHRTPWVAMLVDTTAPWKLS